MGRGRARTSPSAPPPAILKTVDAVFAARRGRATASRSTARRSGTRPSAPGMAGLVELWPPVGPSEGEPPEPWDAPLSRSRGARLPAARLAPAIAGPDRGCSTGERLEARDRRMHARRRHGAGAPAHAPSSARWCAPEGARRRRRRRRPHAARRPARGRGHGGAGQFPAAARGRSHARQRAERPALRLRRGSAVRACLARRGAASGASCAAAPARSPEFARRGRRPGVAAGTRRFRAALRAFRRGAGRARRAAQDARAARARGGRSARRVAGRGARL